jgi:hypothetical protein
MSAKETGRANGATGYPLTERGGRCPTEKQRSEKMFYGDYSYEQATLKIETAIKDHEHDNLVKQLRLAKKGPSSGLVARSGALIMALFR